MRQERLSVKTAKPREGLRRFLDRFDAVGRAIAYNKMLFYLDMFVPTQRRLADLKAADQNSTRSFRPLYHSPDKSEYISRIICSGKAAILNGNLGQHRLELALVPVETAGDR